MICTALALYHFQSYSNSYIQNFLENVDKMTRIAATFIESS